MYAILRYISTQQKGPIMGRGKYERTELTTARMRLTRAETRIQKLTGQMAEAQHQKEQLEAEIAELEQASE
jgi:predicted  nucleic acid-binding Zn-ribbon protein